MTTQHALDVENWLVPDDVFVQACKDLEARRLNYGSWVDGKIPESILTIMKIYSSNVVSVAETVVGMMAIAKIAKG